MKKLLNVILFICLAFTLIAADQPKGGFLLQSVDISHYPELVLRLSVWDANGVPLEALSADNFALETSTGEMLKPTMFNYSDTGMVNIALALDVSGSMAGQALNDAKAASYRLLDRLTPGDQAALIAFSENVSLYKNQLNPGRELDFSDDLVRVYDTIEALEARGGTELYNAVYKAIELTSALPKGHRAVLLLSDGRNESTAFSDSEAAITLAKEEGVPVFVIGLGSAIDRDYLERLANETGGVARFTPRSSELAQAFDDMARLLKGQYSLSYELPETITETQETLNFSLDLAGNPVVQEITLEELPVAAVEEQEAPEPVVEESVIEDLVEQEIVENPATANDLEVAEVQTTSDEAVTGIDLIKSIAWYWWVLAAVVLLGIIILIVRRARKSDKKPVPYVCMRCGRRLTEGELVCPDCGEKRTKVAK